MGTFVQDEGGYTTVAVALALLVSLTLVFSLASVEWLSARSGDVQPVADAAALAGANTVAAFSTVAQTTDACVLSLGLAGMLTMGAGLVIASVPLLQAKAPVVLDAGRHVLKARQDFSRSAAQGLQALERVLPALVMVNSASCISANASFDISYFGCAVPFPLQSQTDYQGFSDNLTTDDLDERAARLREVSAKKEEALRRASAARERAWRADCVDAPMCMRTRAATLAGLSGAANPNYPLSSEWRFGFAKSRACNYYLIRARREAPVDGSSAELSRSCARREFYRFAYQEISVATCVEDELGGHVAMELPDLPRNRATTCETRLYTDALWPCTIEPEGLVLHASLACSGATGTPAGTCSLAMLDAGQALRCPTCEMDLAQMGSVASASTSIANGFEHYWRIVVEESRTYQAERREAAAADEELQAVAEDGLAAFKAAMDQLAVERPTYRPAGMWGCVSLVTRRAGTATPSALTSAFVTGTELPAGAAVSAATLAPDSSDEASTVLGSLFDGVRSRVASPPLDLVGSVCDLWGSLLVGYGAGYQAVGNVTQGLFDTMGSLFGERVGSWLKGRIEDVISSLGLEPADLRLRKPVLVESRRVLDQAGYTLPGVVADLSAQLSRDPAALAHDVLVRVGSELGWGRVTVAELPVPGTDVSIPLTIDLGKLVGVT